MKRLIFPLAIVAVGFAAYFLLAAEEHVDMHERNIEESDEVLYTCPMHPTYLTDRPGDCPICGMSLVKAGEEESGEDMPEGSFKIDARKQQLLGIETTPVRFRHLTSELRTVGLVDYDETRVVSVSPRVHGWVEAIHADYTGRHVQKGDPLVEIYSPELVSTQEEYLLVLRNLNSLSSTTSAAARNSAASLVETTKKRLLLFGITEDQIARIEDQGEPMRALYLASPISGHILEKKVEEGDHVMPGNTLYVISDLSTVWVYADVYEYEVEAIYEGMNAVVTLQGSPEEHVGVIDHIYPFLDQSTRTAKIRIELDNSDMTLRPEMFADVVIAVDRGLRLAVPSEAVLDTGTRKIAFVKSGDGYFEPREIGTSMRSGEFYEVTGGVGIGEEVVTSANFFVDSESKLKAALARAMEHRH